MVHAGHENIGEAVIIVVRDGDCHRVAITGHARAVRNVRKRAVAIVLEQAIVEFRPALVERRRRGAIREENVHAAVVVEVERGHASWHQLDLVSAGALGDILKSNLRGKQERNQRQRKFHCRPRVDSRSSYSRSHAA